MKNKIVAVVIGVLVVVAMGVVAYAAIGEDAFFAAGKFFSEAQAKKAHDSEIAAVYKEQKIYISAIEYNRNMNFMRDETESKKNESDRNIVDSIIENMILMEEAERRGLAATDEEIEEMVKAAKITYDIPEGKKMLDQYCEGAGITIDEYFDILREQAPRTIARQKLKDEIGREYCREKGIEFTKNNPPVEMMEAIDQYIIKLFEENKQYIKYYID